MSPPDIIGIFSTENDVSFGGTTASPLVGTTCFEYGCYLRNAEQHQTRGLSPRHSILTIVNLVQRSALLDQTLHVRSVPTS